jgi:hypothetical protein
MVWPWSLSPLPQQPDFAPVKDAKGRFSNTIAIKARRENRKPKLATSRTEQSGYAQTIAAVAHASVKAALLRRRTLVSCRRHFAVFELLPVVPSCIGKGRFASDPASVTARPIKSAVQEFPRSLGS